MKIQVSAVNFFLFAALVATTVCGNTWADEIEPPPPVATTNAYLYTSIEALDNTSKLGPGDRISYRVLEDKDEARPLIVTDTGEIEVPYYGRVKAEDRTCKQLAQEIKGLLEKDLYYKATVIIAVDQLNQKRGTVYVIGAIRGQAAIPIPSDEEFTVSKAILRAGGLGDFAKGSSVKVVRTDATGRKIVLEVDVKAILEKGKIENDIKLEPGDYIMVPDKLFNW